MKNSTSAQVAERASLAGRERFGLWVEVLPDADADLCFPHAYHGEVQRSVVDSVGDEVRDLAVNLGIFLAQAFLPLLAVLFQSPCVPSR